jgi:hypothetical protein
VSDVQAFSTDEWLSALQDAMRPDAGSEAGKTVRELAESTGIHERRVRILISKLQGQGRIAVKIVTRTGIDGRASKVPAYLIIGGEDAVHSQREA